MKTVTMQITNQDIVFGGAYERYMELIEEFLSRGWEVHHISPKGFSNVTHKNLIHHDIVDINISPRFLPFFIQALPNILLLRLKTKIDCIVTFSLIECFVGVIYKVFDNKCKIVVSIRGDSIDGIENSMENGIKKSIYINTLKFIEKIVLKNADLVIFLSNQNRNAIIERSKIFPIEDKVVYNGVTSRLRLLSEEKEVCIDVNKKIIGYVGLLYEEGKGLKYLIKAFYTVKQEVPETILVIIGDGPDRNKLISLVEELNLKEEVIFLGFKSNPIQYMKGFDLLVLPSTSSSEGFGAVLLESIYVGTPAIGARIGGIPEVLKYDELLFEPRNVEDLSSKIIEIFQNEVSYKKVVNLCEKRKESFMFDWKDEMFESIEPVFI